MKTENEKKELSVLDLLQGFDSSAYDSDRGTEFTVTFETGVKIRAQTHWLAPKIQNWLRYLSQNSGASVMDWGFNFPSDKSALIWVKLFMPGRFTPSKKMHQKVNDKLPGQIKKWLQELIMENFWPDFDYINPLMKKGESIIFGFKKTHPNSTWSQLDKFILSTIEAKRTMASMAFSLKLDFVSLEIKECTPDPAIIQFKLRDDMNINKRAEIASVFYCFIRNARINIAAPISEESLIKSKYR